MLRRVFLAIAGCADWDDAQHWHCNQLNQYGIQETTLIGEAAKATEHLPSVVFTDGEPTAIQSGHLIAGIMGTPVVVHDSRLRDAGKHPGHTFDTSREIERSRTFLRDAEEARMFFSEAHVLGEEIETILLMTDRCWGLTFGGMWPRSTLGLFDLETQKLHHVAYYGDRP